MASHRKEMGSGLELLQLVKVCKLYKNKSSNNMDDHFFVFLAVATCSSLPILSNGVIVYSSPGPDTYEIGATARYNCNNGFGVSGGSQIRTCGNDGTWGGTPSMCAGDSNSHVCSVELAY